jgi:hypothetical protein
MEVEAEANHGIIVISTADRSSSGSSIVNTAATAGAGDRGDSCGASY